MDAVHISDDPTLNCCTIKKFLESALKRFEERSTREEDGLCTDAKATRTDEFVS